MPSSRNYFVSECLRLEHKRHLRSCRNYSRVIRPWGNCGRHQDRALTGLRVPGAGGAFRWSCLFRGPRIQRAWGIRAGPWRPAQPDLILVLLGGAEAAGLQQRREPATRTQWGAGLPLQETGLRRREALAAQKGGGPRSAETRPLCAAPKPSPTPAHISGEPPLQVFSRRVRPPSPSRLPATFSSLALGSRLLAPDGATGVLGSCWDSCSMLLYTCKWGGWW